MDSRTPNQDGGPAALGGDFAPSAADEALLDASVDELVSMAQTELRGADVLDAEVWMSSALGSLVGEGMEWEGAAAVLEHGLRRRLGGRKRPDRSAVGLLDVLLHLKGVPESGLQSLPHAVQRALPKWAPSSAPVAVAQRALAVTDSCGDQTGVVLAFDETSFRHAHLFIGLIDHNLSGVLKTVLFSDDLEPLLGDIASLLADSIDGESETTELAVDDARRLLAAGLAVAERHPRGLDFWGEDLVDVAPLLRTRLDPATILPPQPPSETTVQEAVSALVSRGGWSDDVVALAAARRLLEALVTGSGLPVRPSALALLMALYDGISASRWTKRELDALERALPRLATVLIDATGATPSQAEGLHAVVGESWPDARAMLAARQRISDDRAETMAELVGGMGDIEGFDELRADPFDNDELDPEILADFVADLTDAAARGLIDLDALQLPGVLPPSAPAGAKRRPKRGTGGQASLFELE